MSIEIEFFTAIAEVFLAWYFFSGVFGKSDLAIWSKVIIIVIYTALLTFFSVYIPPNVFRILLMFGLLLCFTKIYFRKPWLASVYPAILFLLLAIISDVLCGTLLQANGMKSRDLLGSGSVRVVYNSLGKLCHLLLIFISLLFFKFKMEKTAMLKALPLLVCQVISIVIYHFDFTSALEGTRPAIVNLEAVGLLFINIIVCVYMEVLNRYYIAKNKAELSEQRLQAQKNQYLQILNRQEETRRLWHDIKKYMAAMETLVSSDANEEMQKNLYNIKQLLEPIENIFDTGNIVIDGILNYGAKKANENGCKLIADIWVNQHMNFPASDLFVIIGNTIDNAVEASSCMDIETKKNIHIQLVQKNHLLFYEITNNFKESQKPKKGIHGYGLKNAKACVERNGGKINISKSNGKFEVSVYLNLGENQED